MTEILESLYQLRVLRGLCEGGADLDIEQIQRMNALERHVPEIAGELPATLKTKKFVDPIRIDSIDAGALVCRSCPWVELGDVVELIIEDGDRSYRFKMRVTACREDDRGDLDVDMSHVGVPVLLRRGPKTETAAPSIERIAA